MERAPVETLEESLQRAIPQILEGITLTEDDLKVIVATVIYFGGSMYDKKQLIIYVVSAAALRFGLPPFSEFDKLRRSFAERQRIDARLDRILRFLHIYWLWKRKLLAKRAARLRTYRQIVRRFDLNPRLVNPAEVAN